MKKMIKECLDWFIKNRFDDIHIVYADSGDYLWEVDMDIVRMRNYQLICMKKMSPHPYGSSNSEDIELCFEIIFDGHRPVGEDEEDYTEAEIFIFEDEWKKINRDFQLNYLLN